MKENTHLDLGYDSSLWDFKSAKLQSAHCVRINVQREWGSCVSLIANLIVSGPWARPLLLQADIRLDICPWPAAACPLLIWPVVQEVRPGTAGVSPVTVTVPEG